MGVKYVDAFGHLRHLFRVAGDSVLFVSTLGESLYDRLSDVPNGWQAILHFKGTKSIRSVS